MSLMDIRERRRGPSLSSAELCRLADITERQMNHWYYAKLIKPSVHDPYGSGIPRRWSFMDVVEAAVAKELMALCGRPAPRRGPWALTLEALTALREVGIRDDTMLAFVGGRLVINDMGPVMVGLSEGKGIIALNVGVIFSRIMERAS